ncbi:MAG: hypothetical protein NZM37_05625 [Sandaracinaceae bacterium]|nr:hypothetical protein [Sandaracinaceae bacterium]
MWCIDGRCVARAGCRSHEDCGEGKLCTDGVCQSQRPDAWTFSDAHVEDALFARDAALPDGSNASDVNTGVDSPMRDTACECGEGELCVGGMRCEPACAHPEAMPCGEGRVCDIASGRCVPPALPDTLTGSGERCGDDGPLCLPGTECALETQRCIPAPPCRSMRCTADGMRCWGDGCVTRRPSGACTPPSLERLNQPDFLLGGDGGIFDLEFDDACHAYAVTMISGPDYLRQLSPDGHLNVWTGVTNLNMGEVAILRRPGNEYGGTEVGEVALTYICCLTCGCVAADPQGVARLNRSSGMLPMVITATPTTGSGPFGNSVVDTGPYGLTWGRDRRLYVGNVQTNGDLVVADLVAGGTREIHRFSRRIHATAVYNNESLLVALEGGEIWRVSTEGSARLLLIAIGEDVTGMVRDPFTGRIYVALRNGRVLELDRSGGMRRELRPAGRPPVRLTYAPDGAIYTLIPAWPWRAEARIERIPLPSTYGGD